MVEILCPHCEGVIEVDDDALGEFECPLCNGEFEWNVEEDERLRTAKEAHQKMVDSVTQTDNPHGFNKMHPVAKVVAGAYVGYTVVQIILVLIVVIFFVFLLLIYLLFGPVMNGSFFA